MNRWNIPRWLEAEVTARDTNCVYCRTPFALHDGPRRARQSWEHIVNDMRIITRENIALCCIGCNASKGARDLTVWLKSKYCMSRGITPSTVAPVVRSFLSGAAVTNGPAPNNSFKRTAAPKYE